MAVRNKLTDLTGQGIDRFTARTRCIYQGVHPGRDCILPAIAVSCQQAAYRLESGKGQVCRAASRQLASTQRGGGRNAARGVRICQGLPIQHISLSSLSLFCLLHCEGICVVL